MKTNVSSTDKIVRLALAIVLIVLFYKSIFTGIVGIIALIVAFVLTMTSLIGFCPLYTLFGINTAKKKEQNENSEKLTEKKRHKN
jgi:predicted RND superfamily exporter protein